MPADPARLVYYVDDNEANCFVFSASFSQQFNVRTLSSGPEALTLIERAPPTVIVTDQRMPGMTGIELLERVRDISPATLRLVLTAFDDDDVKKHNGAGVCGCVQDHFMKPFDRQILERALLDEGFAERVQAQARATASRVDRMVADIERQRREVVAYLRGSTDFLSRNH